MSEGVDITLKIIMSILSSLHRLLLTTIPGRGFKCDRVDGQVVCPTCLKSGIVVPMHYDRHLEIPHKDGIPGCATDRFVCPTCFNVISATGRVGKRLNRSNPFKIICLSGMVRGIKLHYKRHRKRPRKS